MKKTPFWQHAIWILALVVGSLMLTGSGKMKNDMSPETGLIKWGDGAGL